MEKKNANCLSTAPNVQILKRFGEQHLSYQS